MKNLMFAFAAIFKQHWLWHFSANTPINEFWVSNTQSLSTHKWTFQLNLFKINSG